MSHVEPLARRALGEVWGQLEVGEGVGFGELLPVRPPLELGAARLE